MNNYAQIMSSVEKQLNQINNDSQKVSQVRDITRQIQNIDNSDDDLMNTIGLKIQREGGI